RGRRRRHKNRTWLPLAAAAAAGATRCEGRSPALVAAMKRTVLRLEHLRKAFGAVPVADGINLDVLAGETHALIGPNGAGKTSLINQICGALVPDAGRIIFAGRDVTPMATAARAHLGLARSFQITRILARFTALENVALAVQARSGSSFRFWRPAAREEALNVPAWEALEVVELGARAHAPASTLSHGEKRRLELALTLAPSPKLRLLDQ